MSFVPTALEDDLLLRILYLVPDLGQVLPGVVVAVIRDGEHTGALPGRVVRPG